MCARKYGVDEHIRYGRTVEQLDWDDETRRWNIATSPGDGDGQPENYRARAVVSAAGALHLPSYPDIPGAERFGGTVFSLVAVGSFGRPGGPAGRGDRDRRVRDPVHPRDRQAGRARLTCSSARRRGSIPRPDIAIPPRVRRRSRPLRWPPASLRDAIYWLMEARALGFAVHPKLMAPLEQMGRRHIEQQIADPGLRAAVTPDYTIGCKRILLSSDYYPALQRPNVDLITDASPKSPNPRSSPRTARRTRPT